jgi:hypothetical protein
MQLASTAAQATGRKLTRPQPAIPLLSPPKPNDSLNNAEKIAFEGKSPLGVLAELVRHPEEHLLKRWNWKSAVLSSALRAGLFFCVNLTAGWPAAVAAFKTELVFRVITSGFYGALTEAFREAEPAWSAALTVMFLLPFVNQSMELLVHWLRGTQRLLPSIIASACLTAVSTLFNFYVMKRGALIVGHGRRSLGHDLLRLPMLFWDFLVLIWKGIRSLPRLLGFRSKDGH